MPSCPTICNADLQVDLMTSFTQVDVSQVNDPNCSAMVFLTDDFGLNDATDIDSGPWLDPANNLRTRLVSSMAEIKAHFGIESEVYKAADLYFANLIRYPIAPSFILGACDLENETVVQALDAILLCQPCFLTVCGVHFDKNGNKLFDSMTYLAVAEWCQANERIGFGMSADVDNENPSDPSSTKGQAYNLGIHDNYLHYQRGECEKTVDPLTGAYLYYDVGDPVFEADGITPYIDPDTSLQRISEGATVANPKDIITTLVYPYKEMLSAGYVSGRDLSQSNQGYTLAYKPKNGQGWVGCKVDPFSAGTVFAVTGENPDGTRNPYNNGYANVYIQNNGEKVVFNGTSVGGAFIDHIHLRIFLKRNIRAAISRMFVENDVVPYDDQRGAYRIANAISGVMSAAERNGLFILSTSAEAPKWENEPYIKKGFSWVIRADSFASQTAARKSQRLAPQFKVCYIPASAVHHVPIQMCVFAVAAQI